MAMGRRLNHPTNSPKLKWIGAKVRQPTYSPAPRQSQPLAHRRDKSSRRKSLRLPFARICHASMRQSKSRAMTRLSCLWWRSLKRGNPA